MSPCDQNLHLSEQLGQQPDRVTSMITQQSAAYQQNMRSINQRSILQGRLEKLQPSGLSALESALFKSTNVDQDKGAPINKRKVQTAFLSQRLLSDQTVSVSVVPGVYCFFETPLNDMASPIHFKITNRSGRGRVKALLLLSFGHQFPKEGST